MSNNEKDLQKIIEWAIKNEVHDSRLPRDIDALAALKDLTIGANVRSVPKEIGSLLNLKSLEIIGQGIRKLPDSIGNLTNLTSLKITNTNIATLPKSIENLTNLTLHTTKNQHQPIFMGLGVKKLTNCRNTALSLFNNTKRKPSINKSKPNANKLA